MTAIAAWPAFATRAGAGVTPPTPAPLRDDAVIRAKTIAFEERRQLRDAEDQITPRLLSAQYLQRYRERGDVGDILRAEASARRSLRAQPAGNGAALQALASAQLALHRFGDAAASIRAARELAPADASLATAEASLDLETGDLSSARALLARFGNGEQPGTEAVGARLAEMTGDLPRARMLLRRAIERDDAVYGVPNERRAWLHARAAELAFSGGDVDAAFAHLRDALARFPDDAIALTDAARFSAATAAWHDAAGYAQRAVAVVPSPENLGLLADARERLGDAAGAQAARDEIVAVARISDAQRLSDRLLAVYDADHGVDLDRALQIALRDRVARNDPFANDTVAWTAARAGRWPIARDAARRAVAWNTAEPRLWYHAGIVADHDGARAEALAALRHALALNPHFAPGFADDARARIERLERG